MEYSQAFRKSVVLIRRIHDLMRSGKGETAQANELRADSEAPWYEMSDEEQSIVEGLSEDLYDIGSPKSNVAVPLELQGMVLGIAANRNFVKELETVRQNKERLPSEYVAYRRGVCWAELEDLDVAITFFRDAVRLSPDSALNQYLFFRALVYSKSPHNLGEANEIARNILAHDSPPEFLYLAATAVFSYSRVRKSDSTEDIYSLVIDIVERANAKAGENLSPGCKSDACVANIFRSLCYDQREMPERAIEACDYALRLEQNDIAMRISKDIKNMVSNQPGLFSKDEQRTAIAFNAFSIVSSNDTHLTHAA